jgi:hypothetical protein
MQAVALGVEGDLRRGRELADGACKILGILGPADGGQIGGGQDAATPSGG